MAGTGNDMDDFFQQLLQMTQLMADQVIPDLLPTFDQMTLKNLHKTINDTNSSLLALSKLSSNLSVLESKNDRDDPNPPGKTEFSPVTHPTLPTKVLSKPVILNPKSFNSDHFGGWIKLMNTSIKQGKKLADMFYCGLCDVQAHGTITWECHSRCYRHKKIFVVNMESVVSYNCPTCGVHVLAYREDLNLLLYHPKHTNFDNNFKQFQIPKPNKKTALAETPDSNNFEARPNKNASLTPAKRFEAMIRTKNVPQATQDMRSGSRPAPLPSLDDLPYSLPGIERSIHTPFDSSAFPSSPMSSMVKSMPPNEPLSATIPPMQANGVHVPMNSESCPVRNDSDLDTFVSLLESKKQNFMSNRRLKPFTTFCLLCPQLKISDQLAWVHHMSTHVSDDEQNEVECCICNTCIYGNVQKITGDLLSHPLHQDIDILMC